MLGAREQELLRGSKLSDTGMLSPNSVDRWCAGEVGRELEGDEWVKKAGISIAGKGIWLKLSGPSGVEQGIGFSREESPKESYTKRLIFAGWKSKV